MGLVIDWVGIVYRWVLSNFQKLYLLLFDRWSCQRQQIVIIVRDFSKSLGGVVFDEGNVEFWILFVNQKVKIFDLVALYSATLAVAI